MYLSSCLVSAEKIFVDIEYDKKFYITVIATIVGAIFVGIFVAHACVTYFTAKRTKKQSKLFLKVGHFCKIDKTYLQIRTSDLTSQT